jgi:hypothetical protein
MRTKLVPGAIDPEDGIHHEEVQAFGHSALSAPGKR